MAMKFQMLPCVAAAGVASGDVGLVYRGVYGEEGFCHLSCLEKLVMFPIKALEY